MIDPICNDWSTAPDRRSRAATSWRRRRLWGLAPLVVTLYTRNRQIWWAATITSGLLILAIGASRTYLGVHWLSDVVAGLIVGAFFLRGAEWLLARQHRRRPCGAIHAMNSVSGI